MVSVAEKVTVSVLDDLVHADLASGAVVGGNLDLIVPDVDQSFACLDLSVAVFDCCSWWCVAVVMRGGHSIYCTFRHGRHLGTGVDNCVDVALLPDGGLHCILLLAEAVVAPYVRNSDFITGIFPLDMVVRIADEVSGAASKEW